MIEVSSQTLVPTRLEAICKFYYVKELSKILKNTAWTTQDGKSSCGWDDELDVWYSFTPQNSGIYSVELTDEDFTVGLSIFEQDWPLWLNETSEILCKDAYMAGTSYFYAKAGFEYYIRVAGYWSTTGNFTLNFDKISEKLYLIDVNNDGVVDYVDLTLLIDYWLAYCPQPYWCDGCDFDLNKQIDFTDYALMANAWLEVGLP